MNFLRISAVQQLGTSLQVDLEALYQGRMRELVATAQSQMSDERQRFATATRKLLRDSECRFFQLQSL